MTFQSRGLATVLAGDECGPPPVFYYISNTMNKQIKQSSGFGGLEMLWLFKMQELFS